MGPRCDCVELRDLLMEKSHMSKHEHDTNFKFPKMLIIQLNIFILALT